MISKWAMIVFFALVGLTGLGMHLPSATLIESIAAIVAAIALAVGK